MSVLLQFQHHYSLPTQDKTHSNSKIASLIKAIKSITTFGIQISEKQNYKNPQIFFLGIIHHDNYKMDTQTHIQINTRNGQIRLKTNFLFNGARLILPSNQMKISLQHRVSMINQQKLKQREGLYKVDSKNNTIQLCTCAAFCPNNVTQPYVLYKIIFKFLQEHLKILKINQCLQYLLKSINIDKNPETSSQVIQIKQQITKYIHLSYNAINLNKFQEGPLSKQNFDYPELQKYYTQEFDSIYSLANLYNFSIPPYVPSKSNMSLNEKDNQLMTNFLLSPKARISKNSCQNKYLFNFIQIQNSSTAKVSKIAVGGSSIILAGKFTFRYIPTVSVGEQLLAISDDNQQKDEMTKILAIKVPKSNKYADKIENELNVVFKLKGAASAYILKYYSSRQTDFRYKQLLMMDGLINCNTLKQFLYLNNETISLKTKIIIMSHIAQGLRFLSSYNITHMDLKPNNILVILREGLVKLIDFSEAYTPDNNSNYRPGYSFPYSAPQVYDQYCRVFSEKQDSFSFGMIGYEMIYSNLPMQINEKFIPYFRSKEYQKKLWKIIPQNWDSLQKSSLINLVFLYILKCLNQNDKLRCCPSWSQAILRTLFTYQYQI